MMRWEQSSHRVRMHHRRDRLKRFPLSFFSSPFPLQLLPINGAAAFKFWLIVSSVAFGCLTSSCPHVECNQWSALVFLRWKMEWLPCIPSCPRRIKSIISLPVVTLYPNRFQTRKIIFLFFLCGGHEHTQSLIICALIVAVVFFFSALDLTAAVVDGALGWISHQPLPLVPAPSHFGEDTEEALAITECDADVEDNGSCGGGSGVWNVRVNWEQGGKTTKKGGQKKATSIKHFGMQLLKHLALRVV